MADKKPRQALQRGLKALISEDALERFEKENVSREIDGSPSELPVDQIAANPFQPRESFDPQELAELKDSISRHGVLEPVVVRRSKGQYELISGERRLRAVRELGQKKIPAVIRDRVSDREMQVFSLVENLQRSDLNDLEIATGYSELQGRFDYTHDRIAEDTGKSRSFVSNTLRLLKLPDDAKQALQEGKITSGHARALLSLDDEKTRSSLLKRIIDQGLNVRQAEQAASGNTPSKKKKNTSSPYQEPDLLALENRLMEHFKTRVQILNKADKGRLVLHFTKIDDLNRLVDLFKIG